jgi:hypothetical protein
VLIEAFAPGRKSRKVWKSFFSPKALKAEKRFSFDRFLSPVMTSGVISASGLGRSYR